MQFIRRRKKGDELMQVEITTEEYERLDAIGQLAEQAEVDAAAASNRNALLAQFRAGWLTALRRKYGIRQQANLRFLKDGSGYSVKWDDGDGPHYGPQPVRTRESFDIDSGERLDTDPDDLPF
jgi:hypothetical protein